MYMHVCVHVVSVCVCTRARVCVHACTCKATHRQGTNIHTHMYARIYMYMNRYIYI